MERQTDDAPYDDGRMNLCLNLMPVEEVSLGGEAHQQLWNVSVNVSHVLSMPGLLFIAPQGDQDPVLQPLLSEGLLTVCHPIYTNYIIDR